MEEQNYLPQQRVLSTEVQKEEEKKYLKIKNESSKPKSIFNFVSEQVSQMNSNQQQEKVNGSPKTYEMNMDKSDYIENLQTSRQDASRKQSQDILKKINVGKGLFNMLKIRDQLNSSNDIGISKKIQVNSQKLKGLINRFGTTQNPNIFKQALLSLKDKDKDKNNFQQQSSQQDKQNSEKVLPEQNQENQEDQQRESQVSDESQSLNDSIQDQFSNIHKKTLLEVMADKIGKSLQNLDDQVIKQQYQFYEQEEKEIFGYNEDKRYIKAARHVKDVIYNRKSAHYIKDNTFISKIYGFQTHPY